MGSEWSSVGIVTYRGLHKPSSAVLLERYEAEC